MNKSKLRIPDEDFKIIKDLLPQCTNIIKPTKREIVKAWVSMSYELDNLNLGRMDQHHPKLLKAYHDRQERKFNTWMRMVDKITDKINGYPYIRWY